MNSHSDDVKNAESHILLSSLSCRRPLLPTRERCLVEAVLGYAEDTHHGQVLFESHIPLDIIVINAGGGPS